MGQVRYKLVKPIQLTETAPFCEELVFRDEICSGDLRDLRVRFIHDPTFGEIVKVASRLSGKPEELLNKLGLEDFDAVGGIVLDFFGAGRRTGSTPSPSSPPPSPESTPGP